MRKLARGVVIFMLGYVDVLCDCFFFLRYDRIREIRIEVEGLRKACDSMPSWAKGTMVSIAEPIGGRKFENHSREECNEVLGATSKSNTPLPRFATSLSPVVNTPLKLTAIPLEPESFSSRIDLSTHYMENVTASLICGVYGFAGGFGLWLFYRLVRFAIKG